MGDKKQKRKKRLAVIANELKKRELAVNQMAKRLEELKAELDERERSIDAAKEAKPEREYPVREAEEPSHVDREKPVGAPSPASSKPSAMPERPSAEIIAEINEILKSIFWDYSASVQQISSQISTVTAATMCAAVTCILENRSFNAKDVFLQEMQKMLHSGALDKTCEEPLAKSDRTTVKPVYKSELVFKPAAEPVNPPVSKPQYLDADDEDDKAYAPVDGAAAKPRQTEDDILRIGSVIEFQKLGEYGFRNDEKIVRVELPEGIQYLPGNFFYGCSNLKEIWLPDSLLEIGPYSFYGCKSLLDVHIGEKSALLEIGEYAFAMCEALTSFTVPPQVEMLGTSVFRFCLSLEKVHFSKESNLHAIGSHLLQNCTSLEKIRLPDSVTVIPTSMFYGCSKLQKVVARGVDTIEDYAFFGNESLRVVSIHNKKTIAFQAFEGCDQDLMIEYLS